MIPAFGNSKINFSKIAYIGWDSKGKKTFYNTITLKYIFSEYVIHWNYITTYLFLICLLLYASPSMEIVRTNL